jgi:hypothetical protein
LTWQKKKRIIKQKKGNAMRRKILLIVLALAVSVSAKPKRKHKMARFYLNHAGTGVVSWPNHSSLIPGTGSFSVSVWLRGIVLLQKATTGGRNWAISTLLNQAIISNVAIAYSTTSTTDLDDGDWHHIVFTRNSSDLLSLYVDGSFEDTASGGSVDVDNTGNLQTSSSNTGDIDDVRFYKGVVLSALQISNIYNRGFGVRVKENGFGKITSNGFYSNCDDGSGTTVSGRVISSGTWSDNNGSFTSGDLTWKEGGIPLNHKQLTSDFEEHTFYANNTSKEIQFRFQSREGFAINEYKVLEPQILTDR